MWRLPKFECKQSCCQQSKPLKNRDIVAQVPDERRLRHTGGAPSLMSRCPGILVTLRGPRRRAMIRQCSNGARHEDGPSLATKLRFRCSSTSSALRLGRCGEDCYTPSGKMTRLIVSGVHACAVAGSDASACLYPCLAASSKGGLWPTSCLIRAGANRMASDSMGFPVT